MAYLLALLPIPFAFLAESLPLRIMCGFIALLILFFVRESRVSKDRPSEFSQIRFKPENPDDEESYEFFMDRFWQTQMAQKKEVSGDPIYLNSVDVNEIKREAIHAHHIDGPKINLSMVDLDEVKAEIARQMAESQGGTLLSLDMISAEDIRAEIAFEIAQERALQSYDSADAISLDSVDVNAIKATPLEINNAIKRLQQRTMQGARTEMQSFNFRPRHSQQAMQNQPVRVERMRQENMPTQGMNRNANTFYRDDQSFRTISVPSAAARQNAFLNEYRIKPVSVEQNHSQMENDYATSREMFRDQNYEPRLKQQNNFRYGDTPTLQGGLTRQADIMGQGAGMQFKDWQGVSNPQMSPMPQQRMQRMQTSQPQQAAPQMYSPQQRIQRMSDLQVMQIEQQAMQRGQVSQGMQMQQQAMQRGLSGQSMHSPQQGMQRVNNPQMHQMQGMQNPQTMQTPPQRVQRLQSQQIPMQESARTMPMNGQSMPQQSMQRGLDTSMSMPQQAMTPMDAIAAQQEVIYVEPVVPTKARNMEMAHQLRMDLIRRQREEAMQRELALQSEVSPYSRSVDRRRVDIPVTHDRRRAVRRIANIPVVNNRREQMSPVDIANENRKIMEMQAEKLRSMHEGRGS